ncbi:MAG: rhodanese-like domain-containing protein [Gammaproteobacteria bacterium]|nr:rhodanese-like domain-containing protein [Gammaproteobacteria bacterium]
MYKQITTDEAKKLLQNNIIILDIRDANSFAHSHIPNAKNISTHELNHFCEATEKNKPILVYCYHGISSQSVAKYLVEQGVETVYSLIGGFEAR